jgi:cell division protein FtsI/penicillin-binding protein 2
MISVLDNSGTKIREIRKQFARVRISDEESKKLAESGEKYNKKYKMTYRNSINSMHIDKYRRLWVETPVANSDEKHFDIYKDDIFQNRVTLKLEESYRPQFIGSKIVAVNEENSNIKIYEY